MRFVHSADIHLGSPLGGLDLRADAPRDEIRAAPRQAFERLIDYCIGERIDLLLISGDLFDGRADVDTQIFVEAQLRRLSEHGVRCVFLRGNHDAASKQVLKLRLPDGVHELSVRKAETLDFEDLGVSVHGRGFADQHVNGQIVTEYPAPVPGSFNIGMLHTSASGTSVHEVYAPCTVEQLEDKGYDYWALGHIHTRAVLAESPPVVFCGNLQGRHPRETGAKGATVVTVENGTIIGEPVHVDLDVLRWHTLTVDLDGIADEDGVLDAVEQSVKGVAASGEDEMRHVVRITCVGRTAVHRQITDARAEWSDKIQQVVADAGRDLVWIERLRFQTAPPLPALAAIRARDDMVGDLARELACAAGAGDMPGPVRGSLDTLKGKLPQALVEGEDAIQVPGITSGMSLSGLLGDVERDLLSRLVTAEESAPGHEDR